MVLSIPDPAGPRASPQPIDRSTGCRLRPLETGDQAGFRDHLLRLDERSRRLRFGVPVNDAFIAAYAARTLGVRRVGLFAGQVLRGVAELHIDPADPTLAEGAFSLEPAYRERGYGTQLFDALLFEAEGAGATRLELQCLSENVAMRRIARRFGARLTYDGGETIATLDLPPTSLWRRGGWPSALAGLSPEPV